MPLWLIASAQTMSSAAGTSDFPLRDARKIMRHLAAASVPGLTRFAVDIGARDGVSYGDPAAPLFQREHFAGACFEAGSITELTRNLKASNITKVQATISPSNVANLLREARVPRDADFLTLDIDSDDCMVLQALLEGEEGVRPKVVWHELQPELPPPFEFAVRFDEGFNYGRMGAYGFYSCSLAYSVRMMKRFGYTLVTLEPGDGHDALYVRDDVLRHLTQHGTQLALKPAAALYEEARARRRRGFSGFDDQYGKLICSVANEALGIKRLNHHFLPVKGPAGACSRRNVSALKNRIIAAAGAASNGGATRTAMHELTVEVCAMVEGASRGMHEGRLLPFDLSVDGVAAECSASYRPHAEKLRARRDERRESRDWSRG